MLWSRPEDQWGIQACLQNGSRAEGNRSVIPCSAFSFTGLDRGIEGVTCISKPVFEVQCLVAFRKGLSQDYCT